MDDLASVVAGGISYESENECVDSECSNKSVYTPSGVQFYTPLCPDEHKPFIGLLFDTLKEAFKFYDKYADICGFTMRHGTKKLHKDGITVLVQHMLCHHEGVNKKQKPKDSLLKTKKETRGRKTTRCGCLAKIRVRLVDGGKYEVFVFEEKHNHRLATELEKQFLRNNRQFKS
ncbi:hypothetical protein QQ045_012172 [Rhodiola kirilowii]